MALAAAMAAVAIGVIASLRGPRAGVAEPRAPGIAVEGETASAARAPGAAADGAVAPAPIAVPPAPPTASAAAAAPAASVPPRATGAAAPAKANAVTRPRRKPDQPDPNPYGPAR
ncbi:MAG: hypothetical protein WKG00_28355 [Polyangiaceae bacterium]